MLRKKGSAPRTGNSALTELAMRACLVASDAAFNTKDFLTNSSQMAVLAVRDCEDELDRIEQEIDERLPSAIAEVDELEARELLACLRFGTDLERIGDLLCGVVLRAQSSQTKLRKTDTRQLVEIVEILETMLQRVREGFTSRELEPASDVLRDDRKIDQVYKSLVRRYLAQQGKVQQSADVLLMAQALERAGDHATNLAEELFRLIEGRSLRHVPKRQMKD
jgi:phosphate transport system protein